MKLEIKGLTKRFGTFTANDRIDLTVEEGQIHCLLGENGAGKSTLMNMLYGLLDPTEGEILVDGQAVTFPSPSGAIDAGIGMVHQHFMLVPVFTVAENVMLGREETRGGGVLNRRHAAEKVRELSERYGLAVNPDSLIEELPVGVQQRVEIIKALSHDAKVLILDEPTAVLTPQEIDELMEIMRALKAQGTSIIFITHKLREVKAVGDVITVIRRGRVVGSAPPSTPETELAEMMVGREVNLVVDKEPAVGGQQGARGRQRHRGRPARSPGRQGRVVRGERRRGPRHRRGAGQRADRADQVAAGADPSRRGHHHPRRRGHLEVLTRATASTPASATSPRTGPTTGSSARSASARTSCSTSTAATSSRAAPRCRLDAISENAKSRIKEFDIRTESMEAPVSSLSGGNQQKVVVAREFSRPLKVLIASQPTRGVDVGSIEFIHKRIIEERDRGTAVVIVSTELDEIFALSDRIAVMYDGRIVGTVSPDIKREDIGLMMAGAHEPEEASA